MNVVKYLVYKEGKYFVSRCLNFEVASFGDTVQEAETNLKEAVELYLEDNNTEFVLVENPMIKELILNG